MEKETLKFNKNHLKIKTMDELTSDEIVLAGLGRGSNKGLKSSVRHEIGASKYRKHF